MKLATKLAISAIALIFIAPTVVAEDDDVLIKRGDSVITHDRFDARMAGFKKRDHVPFVRDGSKVDRLLNQMMMAQILADQAKAAGFDKDALVSERMAMAADVELSKAWLDKLVEDAPDADYEALAHETYLANPSKYKSKETVDVSHILIATESRSEEEALAKANELSGILSQDPTQFSSLVALHSEDPGSASKEGRYDKVPRGRMVKPFENTAFDQLAVGEISAPVKTQFGYHIIRLDARNESTQLEFDAIKPILIQSEQDKHRARVRNEFLSKLNDVETEVPEGAIDKMVRRYLGENLELAPENQMGSSR